MGSLYADMVRYTSLFIQKYCPIIQNAIPNGVMSDEFVSYGYSSDLRSEVCFEFEDHSYYQIVIDPEQKTIELNYIDENRSVYDLADYKKMLSIIPFVPIDYSKVYEIFDFLQKDDFNYDSIQTLKCYNNISFCNSDFFLTLEHMLVTYELKYKTFYKKLHKKSKIKIPINLKLCFDDEMNIDVRYYFELMLAPKRNISISLDYKKGTYLCNNINMTKDELFNYIKKERQLIIQGDLNKILKKSNISMDIEFNEQFKDQLKIIEMVMI